MAKRFTDNEIWQDDWFIDLDKEYMLFWFFLKDNCNHSGIWKPKVKVFEMSIESKIDLDVALKLFNEEKERVIILNNGRWFLVQFIPFQYGRLLNLANRVHKSIHSDLKLNEVNLGSIRPLIEVKEGVKDKDIEKDIGKGVGSGAGIERKVSNEREYSNKQKVSKRSMFQETFDDLWSLYPNRIGRKAALRHFNTTVKTEDQITNIYIALENYKKTKHVKDGFIQNGSTWFNNWEDWIDYKEPKKEKGVLDDIDRLIHAPIT